MTVCSMELLPRLDHALLMAREEADLWLLAGAKGLSVFGRGWSLWLKAWTCLVVVALESTIRAVLALFFSLNTMICISPAYSRNKINKGLSSTAISIRMVISEKRRAL